MAVLTLQAMFEEPAPDAARPKSSSISLICCLQS
jgi:hypothetical protein